MRSVVALAIDSGQTVEYWLDGDPRNLDTALAIREEQARAIERANKGR